MELKKLYTDMDFANVIVPEGYRLTFYTFAEGKVTKRYKDSNGNYGSM